MRLFVVFCLLSISVSLPKAGIAPGNLHKNIVKPVPNVPFLRSIGHPLDVVYWKYMRYFFGFISYFAVGAQRDFFLLVEKLSKVSKIPKIKYFFFSEKFYCKNFQNYFSQKFSNFFKKIFRKSVQKTLLSLKNEVGLFSEFFFLTKINFFQTKFIFQNFQKFLFRKKCFDNFFLPRPRSNFFDFRTMKFYIKINRNIYIYIPIPDLSGNRTVLGRRYRSKFLFFPIKIFFIPATPPYFLQQI